MHALNLPSKSASNRRQTCLVIVRANGPFFYSMAAAALMEAAAVENVERLATIFASDYTFAGWLRDEWLPATQKRAAALRDYVEETWQEVDAGAALEQYRDLLRQNREHLPCGVSLSREALTACSHVTQAALFYRAVARWSDDHAIRELTAVFARDCVLAFSHFRSALDDAMRADRIGAFGAWQTLRANVRAARDVRVRNAYQAISVHCAQNVPFPVLDYPEFLQRMRDVITRCARPRWPERLVLNPWACAVRAGVQPARPAPAKWFRPVLSRAA